MNNLKLSVTLSPIVKAKRKAECRPECPLGIAKALLVILPVPILEVGGYSHLNIFIQRRYHPMKLFTKMGAYGPLWKADLVDLY